MVNIYKVTRIEDETFVYAIFDEPEGAEAYCRYKNKWANRKATKVITTTIDDDTFTELFNY